MFILGSDDCTVRVWDQRHRASVVNMNAIYQVTAVSFGDSSDQVVSAGIDNVVKVWDTRKPAQPVFQMAGHNGEYYRKTNPSRVYYYQDIFKIGAKDTEGPAAEILKITCNIGESVPIYFFP